MQLGWTGVLILFSIIPLWRAVKMFIKNCMLALFPQSLIPWYFLKWEKTVLGGLCLRGKPGRLQWEAESFSSLLFWKRWVTATVNVFFYKAGLHFSEHKQRDRFPLGVTAFVTFNCVSLIFLGASFSFVPSPTWCQRRQGVSWWPWWDAYLTWGWEGLCCTFLHFFGPLCFCHKIQFCCPEFGVSFLATSWLMLLKPYADFHIGFY